MSFRDRVLTVVRSIKRGSVLTYKEVAVLSGNPMAARAVGNILKKNFNPSIPCHRVIHTSGAIGKYNRGMQKKYELLKGEGAL